MRHASSAPVTLSSSTPPQHISSVTSAQQDSTLEAEEAAAIAQAIELSLATSSAHALPTPGEVDAPAAPGSHDSSTAIPLQQQSNGTANSELVSSEESLEVDGGPRHEANLSPSSEPSVRTQVLRSEMNLRKTSLQIFCMDGSSSSSSPGSMSYGLRFTADSIHPCTVSVHIMAYEKDKGKEDMPPRLKSKVTKREASIVGKLQGLNQHFCSPKGKSLSFDGLEEKDLTSMKTNPNHTYPLVVRMLTSVNPLTSAQTKERAAKSKGQGEGGVKAEDAGHQPQLQSLTTYCTLVKQADGVFGAMVLRQVLWAGGCSYVLHEIFGMDTASRPIASINTSDPPSSSPSSSSSASIVPAVAKVSGNINQPTECVVCIEDVADTIVLPCRHLCLCLSCARTLKRQTNRCPICRGRVHSVLKIQLKQGEKDDAENEGQKEEPGGAGEVSVGAPEGGQASQEKDKVEE